MAATLAVVATWVFDTAVVAGGSMAPTLHPGDVVVACSLREPEAGDILLFSADGSLVVHRLERLTPRGDLIVRGDANPRADIDPIRPECVRGVVVVVLPLGRRV